MLVLQKNMLLHLQQVWQLRELFRLLQFTLHSCKEAFDQIIHDVALQKLHVVFVLDRAGLVGADGPTHHGAFDLSYLRINSRNG